MNQMISECSVSTSESIVVDWSDTDSQNSHKTMLHHAHYQQVLIKDSITFLSFLKRKLLYL